MAGRLDARAALRSSAAPRARSHSPEQALWWALSATALAVLVIARLLTPDASGHGTHVQLGLPPCGFLWLTSLPCPACGLTTAFAHIARFEITSAVQAHPLGVPLFALTIVTCVVAAWGGARRWSLDEALERFQVQRVAVVLAAGTAVAWLARIVAIVLD